ncbi:purine-cytosine permease family protein [Phytoactinopolyspora limicola]|uniref:purine-cytosine permease family protein n=1 Tax=Phytoactinopolyspora limicola TaxID=2715536 RepID=UPI00140E6DE9|nr:cytosine permease [Phytoactinopolyspora limicola]
MTLPDPPNAPARVLERHTIGPIPLAERHGSGKGLFGIWLGVNMLPLTVVTGAIATVVFALPFWWAFVAIVLGNVVGGIFMALHAVQGPQLGVPQMLQARGQFGARGAALIVVIALVMFLGFFISNLVVGAQALHHVVPGLSVTAGICIAASISLVISIFGLRLIRAIVSLWAVVIGALVVMSLIWIGTNGAADGVLSGEFNAVGFFSVMAIGAVWQKAYAPYVSDYSRYLPAGFGARGAFWGTYGGSVLSTIFVMSLGALVGAAAPGSEPMAGLGNLLGGLGTVVLLAFAVASASTNAGNIYCAMLNTLTIGETFRKGWLPGLRGRIVTTVALHAVGLVVAIAGQGDFLVNFKNFILLLLYVLVPWSAINLVDYFLVRRGHYDVEAFFAADGGRYGYWNWTALGVYALGVAVQVPFAVTELYTGPIARAIGGVDLAWMFGLVVSGGVYYLLARRRPDVITEPAQTQAVEEPAPVR